jgi:hypothetical protein
MKQKYSILKDAGNKQLIIREFAELDKELLSLLCEETYEHKAIKSAISNGKEALISTLRTKNLYPPGTYVEKIADAVIDLYGSRDKGSVELLFDDLEFLTREHEPAEVSEPDVEEEPADLGELLEDDFEDDYENKNEISKIDSSLKIADDDFVDVDDES